MNYMIIKKIFRRIGKEINIFFTALQFFTRIPCPKRIKFSEENLNKSSRYFPLIGWIVGGLSAVVLYLCNIVMPTQISILLTMICSILVTGAFHEDGLADFVDGFGGGYTKERVLTIMKDSQIGTFGAIALILMLILKYTCLLYIEPIILPFILIIGHSLSRFASTSLIFIQEYVRENEDSKAKPLAKKMSFGNFIIGGVFGIVPLLLLRDYYYFFLIIPVIITTWILGHKFKKKIGGYTGDCLGATQQLTEVIFYLFVVIKPWIYILSVIQA